MAKVELRACSKANMLIRMPFWLAPRRPAPICRADRAGMPRMAWTAEDRRKYAPAIQEVPRQGMIVRLARTMDALDPQPEIGRERVWSTLIMLQALWHLAAAACPVPALHHRLEPAPPLARAGGARPRPGDPRRLPPPRARPQATADGGDHRHPERDDRAAARAARRSLSSGQPQAGPGGRRQEGKG